jgi:hypothetical protein
MAKKRKAPLVKYKNPYYALICLLVAAIAVLIYMVISQNSQLDMYGVMTKFNPACGGLNVAFINEYDIYPANPSLNASSKLYKSDKYDRTISFHCGIGVITQAATIQGKHIDGYELGADVTYFKSQKDAENYADKVINPMRYWGVNPEGQDGIPQTSLFTFIVSDKAIFSDPKRAVFDAYSVKGNTLVRISLPCSFTGKNRAQSFEKCFGESVDVNPVSDILKDFRLAVPQLNV